MKLIKSKLKQLIKEEIQKVLQEDWGYEQKSANPQWRRTGRHEEDPSRPGQTRAELEWHESPAQPSHETFTNRKCEEEAAKYFPDRYGDPSAGGLMSDWSPEKTEFYEKCKELYLDPNYQGPADVYYKLLNWAEKANLRGFVDVSIPAWERKEREEMGAFQESLQRIVQEELEALEEVDDEEMLDEEMLEENPIEPAQVKVTRKQPGVRTPETVPIEHVTQASPYGGERGRDIPYPFGRLPTVKPWESTETGIYRSGPGYTYEDVDASRRGAAAAYTGRLVTEDLQKIVQEELLDLKNG